MTVEELIKALSKCPKDDFILFYVWDEIEGENALLNFNSVNRCEFGTGIYLE